MRLSRGRAAWIALGAAVTLATSSAADAAADPGKLMLVNAVASPVSVTLSRTDKAEWSGNLILLVRNDGSVAGTLAARFFVKKSGMFSGLQAQPPSPLPENRPAIVNAGPGDVRIAKGQTRLLVIRFLVSPTADPAVADGTLVVTLKSRERVAVAPLVIDTSAVFDTAPARGSEQPQPSKVSLVVTSWWPIWHRHVYGAHQRVLLPANLDTRIDRSQVVVLGSDSGGLLRTTLTARNAQEGGASGFTRGELTADHIGGPGPYAGDLVFGPADNDKLALTVHVRDLFLWPFLVLFVGALLGGLGTAWWENKRRRDLLVAQARRAYDAYDAKAAGRVADRPPPPQPDPKARLDDLKKAINKARTDDAYNKQFDAVATYEADLRRWLRLAGAADALAAQEAPAEAEALRQDYGHMLLELGRPPDAAKEQDDLAARAERLAEIVSAFVPVWDHWVFLGRQPEDLGLADCYSTQSLDDDERKRAVLLCIDGKSALLQQVHVQRAFDESVGIVGFRAALAFAPGTVQRVGGLFHAVQERWRPTDDLPPQEIERRVRRFDMTVATASLLVTLLAYLLTVYGQDFGAWSDYAKAFTAGFVGQVAGATIALNLFPAFRSYQASRAGRPAAAAA